MSKETEDLAWKIVAGLMVFLQVITIAFCGYIVTKLDDQRTFTSELDRRLAVVESIQLHRSN